MIWNRIILLVIGILGALVDTFPEVNANHLVQFTAGLAPFKAFMSNAGWLFPVNQFFIMIGIVMTIEGALLSFKLLHWFLKTVSVGFIK